MAENALAAETRTATGKGVARKLRAAGRIPAVVYGKGAEPAPISVDPTALDRLLHRSGAGLNTLIDLEVGGGSHQVLLKALQREPVTGAYVHADFFTIDVTERVTVTVPLHFLGKAKGVELEGGILDHPVKDVEVECLPTAIPENFEIDVSEIALGESLHVSDLVLPAGVEMKTDLALAVASVVAPKAAVEEEEEEVAAEEGEDAVVEEGAPTEGGE